MPKRILTLILATLALSACLPIYRKRLPDVGAGQPGFEATLQVRFLGVGGFALQRGSDLILTAPLYTNPEADDVLKKPIPPDVTAIDRFHPDLPPFQAILVGHAHYDHLMDVPYVWQRSPEAVIYGNLSMKNLLAGYAGASAPAPRVPPAKLVALNAPGANLVDYRRCPGGGEPGVYREAEGGSCTPRGGEGAWVAVPGSRVRIRALCSMHPSQFLGVVHLWDGCVTTPRTSLPVDASDYQEGDTLAYLIDFLRPDGTPQFRIYYQDAPTRAELGQVSDDLLDEKTVDLALLCVGSFNQVEEPTHIVTNLNPAVILLGHWENFFRAQDRRLKAIPFARVPDVMRQVQAAAPDAEIYLPAPQAQFHFVEDADGLRLLSRSGGLGSHPR